MPHDLAPSDPAPPHLVRQLDESVAEVFAVMLNLACAPAADAPPHPPAFPCLIASVHFSGTMEGCCTLQLTPHTAAELTANLTGIPYTQIPAELFADTAAELCNMIAGSWKTRQPAQRAACQLSCPSTGYAAFRQDTHALSLVHRIHRRYLFAGHGITVNLTFD